MITCVASIAVMIACSPADMPPTAADAALIAAHGAHARVSNGELTPQQKQGVAAVRRATAMFHDFEYATSASGGGYTDQFPAGCAATSAGAQGFHYINWSLVDDKVELLRPELLMYEPGPNGQMNLVGVDYIVPANLASTAPALLDEDLVPLGPPLNVWAIHIWAWRPNPNGMFAPWNPKVSCANAQP
jgi:hypothetical protein